MKKSKIISVLMSAAMGLSSIPMSASAVDILDASEEAETIISELETDLLKFDFNLDGKVTPSDSAALLTYYSEQQTDNYDTYLTDEMRVYIAQFGDIYANDGEAANTINANDAKKLLDYIVSLFELGDVTCDNKLDAADASAVLLFYCENQTLNFIAEFDKIRDNVRVLGDINGDGTINAGDAAVILRRYSEAQTGA
jgi:hypothetical protein